MKKEEQILLSQEPIIIEQSKEKDFFSTHEIIDEIAKIIGIRDISDGVQIIGIFDSFGEGKSSLIKTLKQVLLQKYKEQNYCFIELDLWKYENSEIKNEFHKVFHNEKASYFYSDFIAGSIFHVAHRIPKTSKFVPNELYHKKFIENRIIDDYFAYGLKEKIRLKKKKVNCKEKKSIPIVVIENMDRLTINEKITALSSIYNYKESFQSHIIITLDPDSIRKNTTYFESLIHKCFTVYMYLAPKTKHTLKQYIKNQLPKISNQEKESTYNDLTEMLLTQYPISLRDINHCINTFVMSFIGEGEYKLKFFMAILQVQFHQLYRAISQNPYILKKFIYHANDTNFNEYSEYDIDKEKSYKLNLLIKSLGNLDFKSHEILSILSPQNKKFLSKKNSFNINETIIHIELLRKALLEKDVIKEIENRLENEKYTVTDLDKFLSETIKDRETFINFFESPNFEETFIALKAFATTNETKFLETILSYSVENINDYSFYDNYSKTMTIFKSSLKIDKYSHLLVHRILENFQLARKLIENKVIVQSNEYFINKLKRLSFINKILYTTHFFESLDSNSILTLEDIIKKSIRDIDTNKLDKIDKYKIDIIENFYLKTIPKGKYNLATEELIFDIIQSSIFKRLNNSQKVSFYTKTFNNNKLINQNNFELIIIEFSKLLNETFNIEDIENIINILLKIKIIGKIEHIHHLTLKKFVDDNIEMYGKYDDKLKNKLSSILN